MKLLYVIELTLKKRLGEKKIAEQFSYGFKNLVKLGVREKKSKSEQVGRFLDFCSKLLKVSEAK